MNRPRIVGNGLRRLFLTAPRGTRGIATDADVDKARKYCQSQLQHNHYDAHLIYRLLSPRAQDAYLALRALNLELVRLPDVVSNPAIGQLRMQFWRESIDKTFAGRPPAEPICVLLHRALEDLRARSGASTASSIRFWAQRVIKTREKHMDNRPFASLAALEEYAENTYSTLMYATLAAMPLRSMQVDHLASHIGKACGIVATLRGIPVLAAPRQTQVTTPSGRQPAQQQEQSLLLPLDVMAETNLREEDVFRYGPEAQGFQDAVFKVATRANDHLITAREMLKNLKAGQEAGHEFEHQGEEEHVYEEEDDVQRDLRRGFGVLLEAVPAQEYLTNLERTNFNPFEVKPSWKLAWRLWRATSKNQI
ncbi:NADH dehydrogenase (ubiquinone) complex I, assembly factor 6 [Colletotrichum trifolii]|uniref:NADH dehydrogenase (Ubiquinone) complex I, assembly factor 6 n=1 Tax=Colletotrichum trifolii TaxID=5466 RepID=A0A4R8RQY3_COLTR|nr:NADH dehydrogenase (ubiquinone) complex I, assembly factor 6 [Colletotrichum trifolii]